MTATTTTVAAGTYRLDADRSTIRFSVRELGLIKVAGTFAVHDGTVTVAADPRRSGVTATVDMASVQTGNRRRDNDLRSKRFLDTGRYPEMSFAGTGLAPDPDGSWRLTGTLAVHGVTTPVTLTVLASASTMDGMRCRATARVDRYACGVTAGKGLIGRYVDVELDITATR
jgi:polyisoprenoid-binding protein YceI